MPPECQLSRRVSMQGGGGGGGHILQEIPSRQAYSSVKKP